jgi:AraC-like DNA-binding protein
LAKSANYRASVLASACGVTPRQLERYFQARHHAAPHRWLRDLRMRLAIERIRARMPLKVIRLDLGYKDPAHFAHDFKEYFGVCPSDIGRYYALPVTGPTTVFCPPRLRIFDETASPCTTSTSSAAPSQVYSFLLSGDSGRSRGRPRAKDSQPLSSLKPASNSLTCSAAQSASALSIPWPSQPSPFPNHTPAPNSVRSDRGRS